MNTATSTNQQVSATEVDLTTIIPFSLEKGMDVIKKGGCVYSGPYGENVVLPPQKFVSPHWKGKVVRNNIMLLPNSKAAAWHHRNYFANKWMNLSKERVGYDKNSIILSEKIAHKLYSCSLPAKHELADKVVIALSNKSFITACQNFVSHYDNKDLKEWCNRWFDQTHELLKEFNLSTGRLLNLIVIVDHCSSSK